MKIITTSADKKSSFTFVTKSVAEAKEFLDFVRVHGYEAAQRRAQSDRTRCPDCGNVFYHLPDCSRR